MTHIVKSRAPLGSSVNPYVNPIPMVRRLAYARLQAALDLAETAAAERVLDFGCWAGYFLPPLLKQFAEVWGLDDDSASVVETLSDYWTILQIARKRCHAELGQSAQPWLVQAGGLALPFRDEYFDIVFCLDTLAHVPGSERRSVVAELRRITKRCGQLIFSLPIETGPIRVAKQVGRALTGKKSDPNTHHYDFSSDLALLHSAFAVRRTVFFPVEMLGRLNPFVFLDCRIEQVRP